MCHKKKLLALPIGYRKLLMQNSLPRLSTLDRRGRLSYIFLAIIRSKLQDVLALTGKKAIISIS